jgi:hypothetical protein
VLDGRPFGALIGHWTARACAIFALVARIGALAAAFHFVASSGLALP